MTHSASTIRMPLSMCSGMSCIWLPVQKSRPSTSWTSPVIRTSHWTTVVVVRMALPRPRELAEPEGQQDHDADQQHAEQREEEDKGEERRAAATPVVPAAVGRLREALGQEEDR